MIFPTFTPDEQAGIVEGIVRDAAAMLSDAGLFELIAGTERLRRDLWNHDRRDEADRQWQLLVILGDIQAERRQLANAVEDALSPCVDLGEID